MIENQKQATHKTFTTYYFEKITLKIKVSKKLYQQYSISQNWFVFFINITFINQT